MDLRKRIRRIKLQYGTCKPFEICCQKDIPIEYVNIQRSLADTVYLHNHPIIFLSETLSDSPDRYFVCAHELAHVILHNGLQGYYTQSSGNCVETELEANKFTMGLCEQLYEEFGKYPNCFNCLQHT